MSTQTMKAVRLHEFGGPDELRHEAVPVPALSPGEVLVRVHAASLNPPDWYTREGMPDVPETIRPKFDLPLIPGTDVSGIVAEVAPDVDRFQVGDEVVGMLRFPSPMQSGAYAEYVTAPAEDLGRKPAGMSHLKAAGLPMSGLTAWQFLVELGHDHPSPFQEAPHRPMPLGPGKTVLVNGAAGGVGHLAVQLATARGARVIAVASGRHETFLRHLGVDEFIDYTVTDAADVVRDADVVLDNVGGSTSRRFLKTLRPGGHLYPVYMGEFDPDEVARHQATVTATQVRASGAQIDQLADLVEQGSLDVAIDSVFPLELSSDAHARADRGPIEGKVVLDLGLSVEKQGTREWFEMVGSTMTRVALASIHDRGLTVSLVERYTDGDDLAPGLKRGIRFDLVDGAPSFRAGALPDETADIVVEVTAEAARALNEVRSDDPSYAALRQHFVDSGDLRVTGDPTPLAALLDAVHDPIVDRTC